MTPQHIVFSNGQKADIYVMSGLEKLVEPIATQIDDALKEREQLGLSLPKRLQLHIDYHFMEGATACASPATPPILRVNALGQAAMNTRCDDYRTVCMFFNAVRSVYTDMPQETLLRIVEDAKVLDAVEAEGGEYFEKMKRHVASLGRPYDEFKRHVISTQPLVKQAFGRAKTKIVTDVRGQKINDVRHELDHIDFFSSPLVQQHTDLQNRVGTLTMQLEAGDVSVSKELAAAQLELLKYDAKYNPIIELRAFVFDYIMPGEWINADFSQIRDNAVNRFKMDYVRCVYADRIAHAVLSQYWSRGEMDRATSNVVFHGVHQISGNARGTNYPLPATYNDELARRVFADIVSWVNQYQQNAEQIADAVYGAYRDNPSHLAKSTKVSSFEEFLIACKTDNGGDQE